MYDESVCHLSAGPKDIARTNSRRSVSDASDDAAEQPPHSSPTDLHKASCYVCFYNWNVVTCM